MARRGRPPGPLSPDHAAKVRENGKLGGRPSAKLPPEVYARLGEFPVNDPLGQSRWYTNLLGLLLDMRIRGDKSCGGAVNLDYLAKETRQSITAASKMIPPDIILAAKRALHDDEEEMASDGGPEEEEVPGDDSVRGVH